MDLIQPFVNLFAACSEKLAKEADNESLLGALGRHVMKQFLNESVMVALISFCSHLCW
jgi:hypothetical protein